MHIYRGSCRGNTGQLNKNLIVKNTGQFIKRGDISLVNKKEESRLPNIGLSVFTAPFIRYGQPIIKKLL